LERVASAASEACRTLSPFTLHIGPLAGSSGAISFSASPHAVIAQLRKTLISATSTVLGEISPPDSAHFRPHVGIAYGNEEIAADPIIKPARRIRQVPIIEVDVHTAALVSLTRRQNSYRWVEQHTIPLGTS
jgi:2'-5' RNA ligase